MSEKTDPKAPHPAPMYILLILAICLCAYLFWKFLIIPLHRKKQSQAQAAASNNNRTTAFPEAAHLTDSHTNPLPDTRNESVPRPRFTAIPAVRVQDPEGDYDDSFAIEYEDPERVRRYVAEENRISRLPPFNQDDCGNGSEFPEVPYANKPIEALPLIGLIGTKSNLQLGLAKMSSMGKWLTIDNSYIELHEARTSLLDRKLEDCVQVKRDGEAACDELMEQVVHNLCIKYPHHFSTKTKQRRKHVRNELASAEYSLTRPFDCHPLALCVRLAVEDFSVFVKDDFTLQWYLQASATLFPAGWTVFNYIGKSLSAIINNVNGPMPLWADLPVVFDFIRTPQTLFMRKSTFIQTRNIETPLFSSLFIQRPADFFSGNIYSLLPINLYIRYEHQTFRMLPRTGAIVMSTRTELKKLTELDGRREKEELMGEIWGWDQEEATFKGRDLWIRAVRSWCEGREVWHDDRTVMSPGDLTTVGGN
ncbi:hypothetical protein DE146DRAFT_786591 [Phaeosphaeria sp. MPI-PUGE-AT-0046c]|nr:hypothetical protein DE146DRAFT_786591 [Phaeosphaeria sp. MPI-PUGE-AT-0046c]